MNPSDMAKGREERTRISGKLLKDAIKNRIIADWRLFWSRRGGFAISEGGDQELFQTISTFQLEYPFLGRGIVKPVLLIEQVAEAMMSQIK